jgi:hypothetical protein
MARVPVGAEEKYDPNERRRLRITEDGEDEPVEPEDELRRHGASDSSQRLATPLPVSFALHFRCYPLVPLFYILVCLGFIAVAVLESMPALGLLGLGASVLLMMYWFRVKALGIRGLACAAQVVSAKPYRIAVYADLSRGAEEGFWPVVKVVRQPLGRMHGGPPAVGDLLTTVVSFRAAPRGAEYWADLSAVPAACLTRNSEALGQLADSIPKQQWIRLKNALAKIKRPQEKLYKLRMIGSGWNAEKKNLSEEED